MTYRPTIGLEIHAELATETKMFCRCANDPEERKPNVNVCPVCMAHPGTLPVANRKAIEQVLRVGTALGAALADYSEFDRKSYFYPDIPKGYQISQYAYPFVSGGSLGGVAITRVHLEEDTARSSHEGKDADGAGTSLVDFNRAGVPLMELVTEPVIHDAKTAGDFARDLQLLLRALGASHANLEKGEMRVEANISVSKDDTFGTKVEVKNLNSFRSVERAIEFEIARQSKLLDEGGKVEQETRGWDETKQVTFRQRSKEGSADYRYFPEPDLPKIKRSEVPEWIDAMLRDSLPELPVAKRARYEALGIKTDDAYFVASDLERAAFFDRILDAIDGNPSLTLLAANYFISDLGGLLVKENIEGFGSVTPEAFAQLMRLVENGTLSSRGAKEILPYLVHGGGDPEAIAKEHGLLQVSDTESLRKAVVAVITEQSDAVAQYKAGKEASLQFLIGQAMRTLKGAGNPAVLKELFIEELGKL